jgi:hypothetical protein
MGIFNGLLPRTPSMGALNWLRKHGPNYTTISAEDLAKAANQNRQVRAAQEHREISTAQDVIAEDVIALRKRSIKDKEAELRRFILETNQQQAPDETFTMQSLHDLACKKAIELNLSRPNLLSDISTLVIEHSKARYFENQNMQAMKNSSTAISPPKSKKKPRINKWY